MKKIVTWVILISAIPVCYGQQNNEPDFDYLIELIFNLQEEDLDYNDLYESFLHYYQNPVNINSASREDLQALYLLSDEQINSLLDHKKEYGDFFSLYELYHVGKMDSTVVNHLFPFLTIKYSSGLRGDSISLFKRMIRYSRNSIILRYSRIIESRQGFRNRKIPGALLSKNYYLGSPDYLYGRLSIQVPDDISVGLTVEKDPGEVFYFNLAERYHGFDHYSGFIQLSNRKLLKNLVLGDFQFYSGQGLIAGSGFFIGKGNETVSTIRRNDRGIIPYQGSRENGFFRGVGITLGTQSLKISGFYSLKAKDAIIEDKGGENRVIRSFIESGYHRSPLEFERKNNVIESTIGTRLKFQSKYKNFSIGLTALKTQFDIPVEEKDRLYNRFDFRGRNHFVSGLFYNYYKGKFNVFGETAHTGTGGIGIVQGVIGNLSPVFETALHIRSFDADYFSFYGSTFGKSIVNRNEQGIYWGIKMAPLTRVEIHGFFDVYRKKWLTSSVYAPFSGYDWMCRLSYLFSKEVEAGILYREDHSVKNRKSNEDPAEYQIIDKVKKSLRITYAIKRSNGFYLKSRIQANLFISESKSMGFALGQDIGHRFKNLNIKGRIAYFKTGSYDTRQYMYEHDVLYFFSVPVYYGEGIRYYGVCKFEINDRLNFWMKAGRFHYFERDNTGTGLDTIEGNKKTEIRCQVQLKF